MVEEENGDNEFSKCSLVKKKLVYLFMGLAFFALMCFMEAPKTMDIKAWRAAAVCLLMAWLWLTEALPIVATSMLPIALFPLFGVTSIANATAPYSHKIIYLFMGGFMLAVAMEKWNLHRRLALTILRLSGVRPGALIAGFMFATAFLSMWVSNTATATMMLPIALSVITMLQGQEDKKPSNFAIALLLSIAYSASIGGVATLIGTPPNAILAGYIEKTYGFEIGFGQWMEIGLPLSAVLMFVCWFLLTKVSFPLKDVNLDGAQDIVEAEYKKLGKMSKGEIYVAIIFLTTAMLWLTRRHLAVYLPETMAISDAGIAMCAAVLMFAIPVDFKKGEYLLDWEAAKKLPWAVLVLVGGGLSLGSAITSTGLSNWIAGEMQLLSSYPALVIITVICVVVTAVSHMTSNTATAAAFVPLVAAIAVSIGQDPMLLAVPTVIAASCVFMMPVATPPNAIVFASGMVKIPDMARAGFWLNLVSIVLTIVFAYTTLGYAFGVEFGVVPDWAILK
jgi:sodium-dependent dicarboxylate transporter 2/3/5